MGLCDKMRCRGVTRVVLLALCFGSARPACPSDEPPQNLIQPTYQNSVESASAGFLARFVHSFLDTVQPGPFPTELLLGVIKNPTQVISDEQLRSKVLVYEMGMLVCTAIGILYIVLMPIVGFFVACCRCCGRCGGKMYQKQTSSTHSFRRILCFSVFATTIIILGGNICMFRSNEALKESVNKSTPQLTATINNLNTFITSLPKQLNHIVNEGLRTVDGVIGNLNEIGNHLGLKIQQEFNTTKNSALRAITLLHNEGLNISSQLEQLNSSLAQLQSNIDRVQANISDVKQQINKTMSKPTCVNCSRLTPDLEKPTMSISLSIPGLETFHSTVQDIMNEDLLAKVNESEEYLSSIPQRVTNSTRGVVNDSISLLEDIKSQISQVQREIPLSALNDVSASLNQAQNSIESISPTVEKVEFIRYAVCLALSCTVLLVVVCNCLGLIVGSLGLSPKVDPRNRSCSSDCGGIFFLMGAGFSFLFSWLVMIIVLLLFLLGGNFYTLICRPWSEGQLLEVIDDSEFTDLLGPNLGQSLGLKSNLSISDIYRDCEKNRPLWTTLHLSEIVDLGDILNVSKYTSDIEDEFNSTNVTLSPIKILSPETKNSLKSITTKDVKINQTAVSEQRSNINRSLADLNTLTEKLRLLSEMQPGDIKGEFLKEVERLEEIQTDINTNILPQMAQLNSSLAILESSTQRMNGTVEKALLLVEAAQDFLDTNETQIAKTESKHFLDCQVNTLTDLASWANATITQEFGRCRPVASTIDAAETVVCSNLMESLNAFWFSLGWCTMFFIPSIIFSMKLAKYYRRMKRSDVLENHIIMNPIPRAQLKPV